MGSGFCCFSIDAGTRGQPSSQLCTVHIAQLVPPHPDITSAVHTGGVAQIMSHACHHVPWVWRMHRVHPVTLYNANQDKPGLNAVPSLADDQREWVHATFHSSFTSLPGTKLPMSLFETHSASGSLPHTSPHATQSVACQLEKYSSFVCICMQSSAARLCQARC